MRRKFKYQKMDRRARRITLALLVLFVLLLGAMLLLGRSGYLSAWFITMALAVAGFCALSIPRFVRIGANAVEIHCVVEMSSIELIDVASARRLDSSHMKSMVPLMGIYGFFGYYGYYFDLSRLDMVKVYATRRDSLVEIEDIYEERYIISSDNPDEFVANLTERASRAKSSIKGR